MANKSFVDQSDFIESAAYMSAGHEYVMAAACKAPCTAPCKSCGGGCYGCKGSKGAEISVSELGEQSGLAAKVKEVLAD